MSSEVFSLLAVLAFAVLGYWHYVARDRALARQRNSIDAAFNAHTTASVDARFRFDPATAVLVQEQEECREADAVQSQRIYRNDVGEYFLFICKSGESGYLKHLPREQAMNALRSNQLVFQREFPNQS
jgi:hypothetical protein